MVLQTCSEVPERWGMMGQGIRPSSTDGRWRALGSAKARHVSVSGGAYHVRLRRKRKWKLDEAYPLPKRTSPHVIHINSEPVETYTFERVCRAKRCSEI